MGRRSADTTRSSGSQRMSSSQSLHVSDDDRKKFLKDMVFYIIVQEGKRATLKKADLMKACNLNGKPRDIQEDTFNEARKRLANTFGFDLVELEDKKGQFILVNRLGGDAGTSHIEWPDTENAQMGLLYTVLGLIFMSGDVVKDDVLFGFLTQVGVYEDEAPTRRPADISVRPDIKELFGDVRNLVFKEWGQKQHYLDIKKVDSNDTDNQSFEIRWGERARQEVRKSSVLNIICEMYNVKPKHFKEQYEKVLREEPDAFKEDADSFER